MAHLDFPASPTVGQTYSVAGSPAYTWDGEKWTASAVGGGGIVDAPSDGFNYERRNGIWVRAPREVLLADRTYFVRVDGNDANSGLANTSAGAFLTVNKATTVVASLDLSIYQATVQVGPGTFTGGITLPPCLYSKPPLLLGDTTTPANVVLSNNNDIVYISGNTSNWRMMGFKLTTTAGHGVRANYGALLTIDKIDFGAIAGFQIFAESDGVIVVGYNLFAYTISGSANSHMGATAAGLISALYNAVTLAGTPAFSSYITATTDGNIRCDSQTFAGTGATGQRYNISANAVVSSGGGGANFFPGSTAGVTATGGQYI